MSVMKAIYQMCEEADIMRHSGTASEEEIDAFVSRFCEEYGFDEPLVAKVANIESAGAVGADPYEADMR